MTMAPSHTWSKEGVVGRESPPPHIESEGHNGVVGRVIGEKNLPLTESEGQGCCHYLSFSVLL